MKKHLSLKITVLLALYATLISVLSSWLFYQHSYSSEMKQSVSSAQQLLETVTDTAAIAAFLNEAEMAKEVVSGLAKNDIVTMASLQLSDGQIIVVGDSQITAETQTVMRALNSPFSDTPSGELSLKINLEFIKLNAQNAGIANTVVLIAQTVVIMLVSLMLFYRYLTRPIDEIARRLHKINPGGDDRLDYPSGHQHNEIGMLVSDTNKLLDSTQVVIKVERDLREKIESLEIQYHQIFSQSYAAIFITNQQGKLLTYNQSFEKILAKSEVSNSFHAVEQQVFKIFADQTEVARLINKAYKEQRSIEADLEIQVADGSPPVWIRCTFSITANENTKEPLVEGVLFDITERKKIEILTQYQAEHDKLTGLLNRQGAEHSLTKAFSGGRQSDRQLTLFLLDLDGFKGLNDTYGHDAGDTVLVEVSKRLAAATRGEDCVVRWGGDEFLIIINGDISLKDIRFLGRKIVQSISKSIALDDDVEGQVGVSIGIASLTDDVKDLQELIKQADQAMYEVKYKGKNNFCIFEPSRNSFELEMTI